VEDGDGARLRDGVATLLVNRRFTPESGIARLSRAVQAGDGPRPWPCCRTPT
jgi:hypothetical protein